MRPRIKQATFTAVNKEGCVRNISISKPQKRESPFVIIKVWGKPMRITKAQYAAWHCAEMGF